MLKKLLSVTSVLSVLSTAAVADIEDPLYMNKEGQFISETDVSYQDYDYSVPFKIAGGHLFVDGLINNSNISFLFDSGAGISCISKDFLDKNNISYKITDKNKKTAYGLDGNGIDFVSIELENIKIGNINKDKMMFDMSDIYVLQSLGIGDNAALLGMNFLVDYNKVCFDFTRNKMKIWK